MVRKLAIEIWGVGEDKNPHALEVSTEDGDRVKLRIPSKDGNPLDVNVDDLIYLARALEGMRRPKSGRD
jgi:hypothetical protein